MADSYYYQDSENKVVGPLTPAALKQLANRGVIGEATPVRRGEEGEWYPAGTIAGLVSPKPAEAEASPGFAADAAERARRTMRMAEEQSEKVAAKLWFLDLKFSRFFTPKLAGPLWAICACLAVLLFLGSAAYDLFNMSIFFSPWAILIQFLIMLCTVIAARVILEAAVAVVRVAEAREPRPPSE